MRWWHGILFLFSLAAQAGDSCSPVDLRPLIGPPLNQGDSGYCFAHSSSSLIQARLGVRVSPMELAMHYLLVNESEIAGAAPEAVKARQTPAFYTQWHTDRLLEPANYTPEKIFSESGLINTGGEEMQTLIVANYLGLCDESRLPTGGDVYKKYLKSIQAFHTKRVKDGLPDEGPIAEITDPVSRGMAWSFRHWVEKKCGTRYMPAQPLLPTAVSLAQNLKAFRRKQQLVSTRAAQNKLMDAVNRQLDRGNPVSFGYALSDIMPEDKAVQTDSPVPIDVDHASIIAARRSRGGRCYYYVRNSFGLDQAYHPKLKSRYENGGVWVLPEEIPSMYNAVWLE